MSDQMSGSGDLIPTSSTPSPPSPSPAPSPPSLLIPSAAIVCMVIGVFFIAVILLLIIRKCLLSRGVECCAGRCSPSCRCEGGTEGGCCDGCRELAERLDCSTPDCRVCLDNVCPSRERCSLCCGKLWSCYCCYAAAAACSDVHLCPDCSAIQCPDCSCGDNFHCALKAPDCTKISCLCIEFERAGPA